MPSNADDRCEICRYFYGATAEISATWKQFDGACRRYPPPEHMMPGTKNTSFPLVRYVDWCGEFKASAGDPPPSMPEWPEPAEE